MAHPKPSTSRKWTQTYPNYLESSLEITVPVQYKGEVKRKSWQLINTNTDTYVKPLTICTLHTKYRGQNICENKTEWMNKNTIWKQEQTKYPISGWSKNVLS